jgi:diacylglycerol kinase (ATP)
VAKKDKIRYVKLIANPGAGKAAELNRSLKLAVGCLDELGVQVDVALAKPKEEATRIAEKAVDEGYKTVVAMGGDGTVEAVMRGLVGSNARLGILPYGTENNVAKSLGIPEKLEEACALIADNNSHKVDIGQVKLKNGKKTYFFELTVIGLVAALYPSTHKFAKGKFQLSKIKDAAQTFIQQDHNSKVYLKMDDDSRVEAETMLVVVSNTPMFGANFLVSPNASLEDGLLDVAVYPNFNKAELVAYYASIMNQGYSDNEKVQHYRVRKLRIKTTPPMAVNADAIDLGNGDVNIKCLKSTLRVLAPEPDGSGNAVAGKQERTAEPPPPLSPPEPVKETPTAVAEEKAK